MINIKNAHQSGVGYYTFVECSNEIRTHLLRYSLFLSENDAYQKVLNDKYYSPSEVWKKWLSGTIFGCSNDTLLLKSGHRFVKSSSPFMVDSFTNGQPKSLSQKIKESISFLKSVYAQDTIASHLNKFKEVYPHAITPPHHSKFIDIHAFPYLRALEVLNLSTSVKPQRALEIGAGACVNVALYLDLFKTKFAVVDLPETIYAGYIFLKSIFPDLNIALPCDINRGSMDDYDVVFVLPYQTRDLEFEKFDAAFNMSSFQEMKIEVVNNYLEFIYQNLTQNGQLILCNQKKSRYIEGNSFGDYQLEKFIEPVKKKPLFQNYGIRQINGLEQFFYQARKA